MIINERAGSGGDLLPYMFRAANLGPLVGTRTWGGLVGTWDTPLFIDFFIYCLCLCVFLFLCVCFCVFISHGSVGSTGRPGYFILHLQLT